MIFITVTKQQDKTPWRWCSCVETCRSAYGIYEILL